MDNLLEIIKKLIKDPWWIGNVFTRHILSHLIRNDESYIKWEYFFVAHKFPNLKNPQTYNEKLQWLKLHDRKPEYSEMVDKVSAKEYVAKILGDEMIIPTLGIWDNFDEIDFDKLPNQFVLKCTHDSGGLVVCVDKTKLDRKAVKRKIEKSLKSNYYLQHREYPYKNVQRRIIAEKFMIDESGTELKDYKCMCFNGKCKIIFVCSNRNVIGREVCMDFFDEQWNHLPFYRGHPNAIEPPSCPVNLKEMVGLANKIAKRIGNSFSRIDFYNINGRVYFGEITFFPGAGLVLFVPSEWDKKIGDMLILPSD